MQICIIWKNPSFFFSDSISPIYPGELKNTNFSTLNSYKNRRSRSMWNLVETMLRHQGNTVTSCIAQFATRQEIWPKLDPVYKSSDYDKSWENGISAMPRSFLRISIWNFNAVVKPHVHTNGKPGFFLLIFFTQHTGVFAFFGYLYRPYLSNKKKKRPASHLLVCA